MSTKVISYPAKSYATLFASDVGKVVLKDLQDIWRSPPNGFDATTLAHLEGQRHVIRYIEALIKAGEKA